MDEEDDEWDWDEEENFETEEENVETEADTKKDNCKITADNMHHFGFYLGQSGPGEMRGVIYLCCCQASTAL